MQKSQFHRVGGNEFYVSDCQVWAEIWYLDSPTNYREYIEKDSSQTPNKLQPPKAELQMLDELRSPARVMAHSIVSWIFHSLRPILSLQVWIGRTVFPELLHNRTSADLHCKASRNRGSLAHNSLRQF